MENEPLDNKKVKETGSNEDKVSEWLNKIWNHQFQFIGGSIAYSILFFIGTFLYQEVMLHFLLYRSFDLKMIYPLVFSIPGGIVLSFLTGLFTERINKVLLWVLSIVICLVFQTQLVYFNLFKVFFSFQTLGMAGDAFTEFGSDVITAIKQNLGGMVLLSMPLLLLGFVFHKLIDYSKRRIKIQGSLLGGAVLFHLMAVSALLLFGKGDYSPYDLYYNSQVHDLCGKQLGIITMTRLDIARLTKGKEDLVLADTEELEPISVSAAVDAPKQISKSPEEFNPEEDKVTANGQDLLPVTVDTSPNIMDINFEQLAKQEKNDTIKTLHEYFATVVPTNKNEYTGIFQGYNLILITAEGFSPYAVSKEKTPTLYHMLRESFVFPNFYTPLWQTSTSDGEYVVMTGLIPNGTRSMYNGRKNLWPFSLGNQFRALGIDSKAYHNHTYTYYQREITHPNLGYNYKGVGNGLKLETRDIWPASDLEMINATVDEYMEEEAFHVYYMTVSGHMNYTFSGNSISFRNKALVDDLPYSDDARAYIACQMELDKALEQLIASLEEAGVADRTVIALSADHYPYGWEKYKLDELAGHEVDPDFEVFENYFILWNKGMKKRVVVDKPCSSLDILPTLSNLFGLEYDSRLLMGQDVLSDSDPLVVLSDRSFITDKVKYNSETGEVIKLTEEKLPEDYISNLNKVVKNKFMVSQSILEEDYYRYLFPD